MGTAPFREKSVDAILNAMQIWTTSLWVSINCTFKTIDNLFFCVCVFVRDNVVCTHAIFLYINETDHAFSSSHLVWNLSDMTVTLPSCSNIVLNIIGTKSNPFIVISDLMLHSKPQPDKYPSWKFLDILVLFPNDCVLISFVIPKNARKPVCNLLYSQNYSIHIHGTTESLSIRYVVFHWFMIVKIVWKRSQSEVFWKKTCNNHWQLFRSKSIV